MKKELGLDVFFFAGDKNILGEDDFGIKSDVLAASIPFLEVLAVKGLWAPPFFSPDFQIEVRLFGERVRTEEYSWNGSECLRRGAINGLNVRSIAVLSHERRVGVLEFTIGNDGAEDVVVPVQINVRGCAFAEGSWDFSKPRAEEREKTWSDKSLGWKHEGGLLVKPDLAVLTDLGGSQWHALRGCWESEIHLEAGEKAEVRVAFGIGPSAAQDAREFIGGGPANYRNDIFEKLPVFYSDDESLVSFYNRSLVPLLLNKWRVPDLVLNPYYSTGGINGGCTGSYLWDIGEIGAILALYDPSALKEHIKQFLRIDLTKHYAFSPISGKGFGPWYPVNQEKIIYLTYQYLLFSGDSGFLRARVDGKSVAEWILFHAALGDDREKPVSLVDYGDGNNHLELRGKYQYDHYLPDLNARRYDNFLMAAELAEIAGIDAGYLRDRAESIEKLVREKMWSRKHRWFFHMDRDFGNDLRYTVQMFMLLGSGVLDAEESEGLLSHLNEEEFLSAYGLHSMSKLDEAYDQIDLDNGGGGCYVSFPPQVAQRLYKIGRPDLAEDILRRILWWGERMPYWGDSLAADCIEYRRDTPLQCSLASAAVAQCFIFGMFGIDLKMDGTITINPHAPRNSGLKGLKIRGRVIDIHVKDGAFTVITGGKEMTSRIGIPVVTGGI